MPRPIPVPVAWRCRPADQEDFAWIYFDRWEPVLGFLRQGWRVEALLPGGVVGVGAVIAEEVKPDGS